MNRHKSIKRLVPSGIREILKKLLRIASLRMRSNLLEIDVAVLYERIQQLEDRLYEIRGRSGPLERAHGIFDQMTYNDGILTVNGWMILPDKSLDGMSLYVNHERFEEIAAIGRKDVEEAFPFVPHARHSGFSFAIEKGPKELEGMVDISVVGLSSGREIAKLSTWFRTDLHSCLPIPPEHLMLRISGNNSPSYHLATALQDFRAFWTTICRHRDPSSIDSVLDWGSGCGRITGFFLKFSEIARICGCDIDAEAISWCNKNLKPANFSVAPLYPPTDYPDNEFDLIISFSVLTHLERNTQLLWLKEMQRLLAPGGLFLASTHGRFYSMFTFPGRKSREILRNGIHDAIVSDDLGEVAPQGYYRGVIQSKGYTIREYSRFFDIVEYIERGVRNYQDLVVMKKKEASF